MATDPSCLKCCMVVLVFYAICVLMNIYLFSIANIFSPSKPESSTDQSSNSSMQNPWELHWTSLYGSQENDSYHFCSAYYDSRPRYHRPAVFVLGYAYNEVPEIELYCVLTYTNGSKTCFKEAAYRQHPCSCFSKGNHEYYAKELQFFCPVKPEEEPPVSVQLSTSNTCDPQFFSGEIPVQNRRYTQNITAVPAPKKFGVCIGGTLVRKSNSATTIREVVEFVEMSTSLGVELIVIYVNETQVDAKVLKFIKKHYPNVIRTVGWKAYKMWYPLHYYNQYLLIADCLYRMMYEVEYLAFIDLDEMIIPLKHRNWADMMTAIGNETTVSFKFANTFFEKPQKSNEHEQNLTSQWKVVCPNISPPKYITRTVRIRNEPNFSDRTKIMSRARYIYDHNIHTICHKMEGTVMLNVPADTGLLAHYRYPIPGQFKKYPKSSDFMTERFMEQVSRRICEKLKYAS